jgi:phosphoserine phosphatase
MRPTSVLATVTGRDRPGVTAAFFAALAAHDVDVRDVEQVVIRDRLILTVLFDLRGDTAALRNSVTRAAGALGMECEIAVADQGNSARPQLPGSRSHVIVVGHPLRPGALSHVAQRIADMGGNIETVTQLSTEPVSALDLLVRTEDPALLGAVLVEAADDTGVDIAIEPAGLRRRAKRLVLLDLDSTLMPDEALDALAGQAGVGDQAAEITARAGAGELDTAAAVRERVALLGGVGEDRVDEVRNSLQVTPEARTFVRTLRRLGFFVGVVSGSFTVFTDRVVDELGLDFAAANELEIADGVLTGEVLEPIMDRAGRAAALRRFADSFGVPLSQCVGVGDGADDIDMLETAGLSIAFTPKPAARAATDESARPPYLDTVLFVLGITREEIDAAAADSPP